MNLQPTHLKNDLVTLVPLHSGDFEKLYLVAADPLIWEQHPKKQRYRREVFREYFDSAIDSGSSFLIYDSVTGTLIGSSRYYDYDATSSTIAIGFTFLARSHWGGVFNMALKQLMINYAFEWVDAVLFHIGADNLRSQMAIQKTGAVKIAEIHMNPSVQGDPLHFVFEIKKMDLRAL